jgi:NADPH2:quinone reductase
MQAVTSPATGLVTVAELPEPVADRDEVIVDIELASINGLDRLAVRSPHSTPLPHVLGAEAVGRFEGRMVLLAGGGLGVSRDGTFAQRVAVPRSELRAIPADMQPSTAAVAGIAGKTAWRAVHQLGRVRAGDAVVVLGASGGVGLFSALLAAAAGADVIGVTARRWKAERLRAIGVEALHAGSPEGLAEHMRTVRPDVVIDPVGGEWTSSAAATLGDGGRLVLCGTLAGSRADIDLRHLITCGGSLLATSGRTTSREDANRALDGVLGALAAAAITIPAQTFPLSDVAAAFALLDSGRAIGKVLLQVAGSEAH